MTPDELHERLVNLGREWAELNAASELLDESKKSVRAQYAIEHLSKGGPVAKAELAADSDLRYRDHLKAMVDAKKKSNIARVNYDSMKTYVDLWRSKEATERAAMSLR